MIAFPFMSAATFLLGAAALRCSAKQ
jgi:hypothetical protein